jgi:hypothetical protein
VRRQQRDQIARQALGVRPRRIATPLLDQGIPPEGDAAGDRRRIEGEKEH